MPLAKKGLGNRIRQFVLVEPGGQRTTFTLEPACNIPTDGAARIQLAGDLLKAGAPSRVEITVDFPEDLTWYASSRQIASEPGFDAWYEFKPDGDPESPSEIGMQDWIEAPAGKHGRLERQADKLVYHGKPIKLWGLNP